MFPARALVTSMLLLAASACGAAESGAGGAPSAQTPSASPPSAAAVPAVDPAAPAAADAATVLAGVEQAAHDAGTARYEAVYEQAIGGAALEVQLRLAGVIDVPTDRGTAELELLPHEDPAARDVLPFGRARLSWTAQELTIDIGGQGGTAPRSDDDSLIARVPGEPAGLLAVLGGARNAVVDGTEPLDGVPATRIRAVVAPRTAVEQGLGTQAHLVIASLDELPVQVWVDGDGRPVRIRYSVTLPSAVDGPASTLVTTYDYAGWGEPVDLDG